MARPRTLLVGQVLVEPVDKKLGSAVRERFVARRHCPSCGIEYEAPPPRMRWHQRQTGDVIEHTYRHADGCAGGEHVVMDVTYIKEGSA